MKEGMYSEERIRRGKWVLIFIICGIIGVIASAVETCQDKKRSEVPDHLKGTQWDWSEH